MILGISAFAPGDKPASVDWELHGQHCGSLTVSPSL